MRLLNFDVGPDKPFFLIAGPCVVESEGLVLDTAGRLKEITTRLGIPFIFKSSFDKANRSSKSSFRGPGMEEGLRVLSEVKRQLQLPILTDVHEDTPLAEVARRMLAYGVRHLPVVVAGEVIGMVSARDLLELESATTT